jgi:hypothetical protein
MEVHHHAHDPAAPHHKKSWKSYFWEFLMLFLAVFCGFLAEYQLEHKIERDREKDYMIGMLADLSSDTTQLNQVLFFSQVISNGLDSLIQNLYSTESAQRNTETIYRQYMTYTRRFGVSFSEQTATQLKNSGQLRLVRNKKVMNQLSAYWRNTSQIEGIQYRIEGSQDDINSVSDKIINAGFYGGIIKTDSVSGLIINRILPGAALMTYDKNSLISLGNKVGRVKRRIDGFYLSTLTQQKNAAIDLIGLIKKEYKLE